jgi:thiamine monophosphate synthase
MKASVAATLIKVPNRNVPAATPRGAVGVAVINAIFKADDPESATRAIAAAIGK